MCVCVCVASWFPFQKLEEMSVCVFARAKVVESMKHLSAAGDVVECDWSVTKCEEAKGETCGDMLRRYK